MHLKPALLVTGFFSCNSRSITDSPLALLTNLLKPWAAPNYTVHSKCKNDPNPRKAGNFHEQRTQFRRRQGLYIQHLLNPTRKGSSPQLPVSTEVLIFAANSIFLPLSCPIFCNYHCQSALSVQKQIKRPLTIDLLFNRYRTLT